jgi:hypothetical protein
MSKEIVKPWYCVRCWSVYHDHDGSLLAALKSGKPATCDVSRAPEISPSQSARCGGDIQPLAWP